MMKTIGDLLARDLSQKIEEIIKVDQTDEQSVYTEITEYVATDRIKQQYGDLLQAIADAPAEPSIRENVAAVEAAAEQGMRLIARVRELARLTRPFVMRPVSLAAVVVEALAGLAERVGTDCAVAVETRAPLPTVPGERAVLTLAVRHLIANALDATPPGGRIRVVTAGDRDSVSCRVIDTGPGVAADIRPRVFEPFASTRREPGRGLGLTVARAVAARHGGDVELAAAPGGGTIATLRVPRTR